MALRCLLVFLMLAPTASAATVSTTPPFCPKGCFENGQVEFAAAAGEANDVTVTRLDDRIVLHDAANPVTTTSADCAAVDANTVRCVPYGPGETVVDLGDGDDRADVSGLVIGAGGPGNDRLRWTGTGYYYATLSGDAGDDELSATSSGQFGLTLSGGDGDDRLTGTAKADTLAPGLGADVVEGGAGTDVFVADVAPLVLDLTLGHSGEDPIVTGIEDVRGSPEADRITGDAGANRISGGVGEDVISGGEGDDRLEGGADADVLDGGGGFDALFGFSDAVYLPGDYQRGDAADELRGGPGEDQLGGGPGADRVGCGDDADVARLHGADLVLDSDCETLRVDKLCVVPQGWRRAGGRVVVPLLCQQELKHLRRVRLTAGGTELAVGRTGGARLTLHLTRAGRERLTNGARVAVRVSVRRVHGPAARPGPIVVVSL